MREYEADILRIECSGPRIYCVDLLCEGIAGEVVPGQFVQVRVSSGTDPFLRRTFSVCGADPEHGRITLLIDEIGPGTSHLCSMKAGERLDIIGALGSGFDMELGGNGSCILAAGGVGAAPLLFLAERLRSLGRKEIIFMMGARHADSLAFIDDMICDGVTVMTATDDGSRGHHGMVSELLALHVEDIKPSAVYTCGPRAMMKTIARIANHYAVPCQVSLEERMACGIGVCLGCTVRLKDGRMVRSCVDGPVFKASEVDL